MRALRRSIDRLTKRDWPDGALEKYVGAVDGACLAYAKDDGLRVNAASGGTVSAILIDLMEQGAIDGALTCRGVVRDGHVRAEFFISQSRDDILQSQGSKYVPANFTGEGMSLIKSFPGRLAVVGLPCDISVLRRRMEKDPAIADKIELTLAIVCGHNSESTLVDQVTAKLESEAGAKLTGYRFRRGHWRGKLNARFDNGKEIDDSYGSRFGLYQNLYFWSEKKCFQCNDHFGYQADISLGDVWSQYLRNEKVKYSGVLTRTTQGRALFDSVRSHGALETRPASAVELLDGQARTAPYHYNVSARAPIAGKYGLKLKDNLAEPVRWNERLVAHLTLYNWRWSNTAAGRRIIFKIPKPVLKAYLYFMKFLESF